MDTKSDEVRKFGVILAALQTRTSVVNFLSCDHGDDLLSILDHRLPIDYKVVEMPTMKWLGMHL